MSRFTALYKKCCLQLIQIFLWNCRFFNLLRNTNFPSISELLSERVNFWLKSDDFSEFPRKCFKATGKHSLAVCCSFWGEKQFLLIFVPFYRFDKKVLFKKSKFSAGFTLFKNWLISRRKTVFVNTCPVLLLCTKRIVYN